MNLVEAHGASRLQVRTSGRIFLAVIGVLVYALGGVLFETLVQPISGAGAIDVVYSVATAVAMLGALLLAHAITGMGIWPASWREVDRLSLLVGGGLIAAITVVQQMTWIELPTVGFTSSGNLSTIVFAIGTALIAVSVPASRWRPRSTWWAFAGFGVTGMLVRVFAENGVPLLQGPAFAWVSGIGSAMTMVAGALLADGALGLRVAPEWLALAVLAFVIFTIVGSSVFGGATPFGTVMSQIIEICELGLSALIAGWWRGSLRSPIIMADQPAAQVD